MKKSFNVDGINYSYDEEIPYIIEVEGEHDNESITVDISEHEWEDQESMIEAIHQELDLQK